MNERNGKVIKVESKKVVVREENFNWRLVKKIRWEYLDRGYGLNARLAKRYLPF